MSKNYSDELQKILQYTQKELVKEFPTDIITIPYVLVAMLDNEDSIAYKALSKIALSKNVEAVLEGYRDILSTSVKLTENEATFINGWDNILSAAENESNRLNCDNVNSGHVLAAILMHDDKVQKVFKEMGVTVRQYTRSVETESLPSTSLVPVKRDNKKGTTISASYSKAQPTNVSIVKQQKAQIGEAERNLINLNNLAAEGKIEQFYTSNESLYTNIFATLSKRYNNNIVVTGRHGVGKTAFVKHIANMLKTNNVPEPYKGKILLQVDFSSLMVGTMFRGSFEAKIKPIIEDARGKDKYIFFIDDIHTVLDNRKFSETDVVGMIETILEEKNIPVICTTSDNSYSNIVSELPSIARKLQKVAIEEPSVDETVDILENSKERLELYHNVLYPTDVIKVCARMSKQYITDKSLPESAIDILDEVGAKLSIERISTSEIDALNRQLDDIHNQIDILRKSEMIDYDFLDSLIRQEIKINTDLSNLKKSINISLPSTIVSVDNIKHVISYKTKIPLEEVSMNEKDKLKNIAQTLKNCIIGQDEAIDEVCKVVKRQRVGLSSPTKPSVFFFVASSGVGKTFLAKKLAEKVFGDEKYLVRLDMSEYADKTSTNKLIGAGSGYIGYDKGGVLTEAIKQKKYCVLLLDEIEKAHDEVHNMFLQMFDDGRMTDNHGVEVDFKNVIVIMTSNVGAAEAQSRGGGVGFMKNKDEFGKSIMTNELKKKFKPEFINRIDKIIYFNRLEGDNLKKIIELEIQKVVDKVKNIGYDLDDTITKGEMVDKIFETVKTQSEYGARPIIREVQTQIEDKITDLIIENELEEGHVFTAQELL